MGLPDILELKELFLAASELPPESWSEYLESAGVCGALRGRVLRQLALLRSATDDLLPPRPQLRDMKSDAPTDPR